MKKVLLAAVVVGMALIPTTSAAFDIVFKSNTYDVVVHRTDGSTLKIRSSSARSATYRGQRVKAIHISGLTAAQIKKICVRPTRCVTVRNKGWTEVYFN